MGGPRVVDLAIQPVPPMLELLQFHPAFGLMNPSPFCMKVEVFLRLSGLPYRCRNGEVPLRMPKRKDRKSTRLNSSHIQKSRMPSSA